MSLNLDEFEKRMTKNIKDLVDDLHRHRKISPLPHIHIVDEAKQILNDLREENKKEVPR